jgi:hypothetical protein
MVDAHFEYGDGDASKENGSSVHINLNVIIRPSR